MDRRIVKTREAIMKAYLDLITEKGTSRVSISELARRANIDRKTFYLHYNSVDDVLREYVENKFNRVVSVMEENHYFDDPFNAELLVDLLDRFYKEEEELLLAVAGSDSYDDLWIKLHDILADKTKDIYAPLVNIDSGEINVFYDFFTAGVIDVYRRWSRGEYSYDLRHMVELIGGVVRTGLDPFLKEQLHKEVCLLLKKELQGENLLTIAVDNRIDYHTLPLGNLEDVWGSRGKNKIQKKANYPNFDFFNYCGITRPVRLLVMPESYIDDITIVPEVEITGEGRGNAVLRYPVGTCTSDPSHKRICRMEILDREGNVEYE